MKNTSLSSVTLATIENYRVAANQAAHAYRAGGHRLVGAVNDGIARHVEPRTARFAPRLSHTMRSLRGRMADMVVKGIDQVAHGAEKVVDASSHTVAAQCSKVAHRAAGVDNALLASGLQTAARLSLPGAKLALAVSGTLAEGAKALSTKVRGPVAKQARQAATRRTTRAKRTTAAVSRKAVTAVQSAVNAPKKAVARAKRKLA